MKRIKENFSEQGILFSNHYVGDRLKKNDEVYLFKDLIDKLDISAIINSYSPEGGSMFAPVDQLAIITFAMFKGVTSSVMMADLVRNHLQFIYLAGGHIIARRTISDFRIKHKESIRKIFESTVDMAIDCGLVRKDELFALDGAKFEANASFSKTRRKKEWEERQEKIVEYVDNFLEEWEKQDELEEGIEEKIPFASDAGYNKGKNLEYLDKEKNIDPYVSMFDRSGKNDLEENKFHKENFTFDEEDECWICPVGEKLEFMKEHLKDGKKYTLYGCQLKKCIYCPHRDECVTTKEDTKKGYRTIDDDGYLIYRKEMRKKMELESSKKIYAKRSGCVEPVFGQIKNNRGMKRFRLKGLEKVKAEFLYMAIAHNLGKIMKHKPAMIQ